MNTKEINNGEINEIIERIVAKYSSNLPSYDRYKEPKWTYNHEIPVEASASHIHLSAEALKILFGNESKLETKRFLSQPGEFLTQHRVKLVTANSSLERIAVIGPLRQRTQVELSQTDAIKLGLNAPINLSGDFRDAADILIVGKEGLFEAKNSVIVARAHIHFRVSDAQAAGVSDGDLVSVRVTGKRGAIFENVIIRVNDNFSPVLHIDYDEANACGLMDSSQAFFYIDDNRQQAVLHPITNSATTMSEPYIYEKLITEDIARRLIANGDTNFLSKETIITPSAKDVFLHAGVELCLMSKEFEGRIEK